MVAWPSRPSWAGLRVGTLLERVLPGVPVAHEDDGSLAALAEAAATGARDLAYLGVGTGIGGGLVLGGALHSGPRGGAAEIGHMVVDPGGPVCVCGRVGCLQAVASGTATLARAAALLGAPVARTPSARASRRSAHGPGMLCVRPSRPCRSRWSTWASWCSAPRSGSAAASATGCRAWWPRCARGPGGWPGRAPLPRPCAGRPPDARLPARGAPAGPRDGAEPAAGAAGERTGRLPGPSRASAGQSASAGQTQQLAQRGSDVVQGQVVGRARREAGWLSMKIPVSPWLAWSGPVSFSVV
ncbi:ROK family protein [Streptomyces sp. INA 01156]